MSDARQLWCSIGIVVGGSAYGMLHQKSSSFSFAKWQMSTRGLDRLTVNSSRLFSNSDNEEAASQSEITSSPILEDSITVMPPDAAPTPVPTEATNADTARPRLNYRQRRYLTRMAAKMARAYISSV